MTDRGVRVTVVGGATCDDRLRAQALETGRFIAEAGAVLICGGRGGVMSAAAEGARSAGGRTVGILPGASATDTPANPHIELPIYTGMGQARNQILVLSADAIISIGGGWGTLSEIGLALKHGIPVVLLNSWRLHRPDGEDEPRLQTAESPDQAVELALGSVPTRGTL